MISGIISFILGFLFVVVNKVIIWAGYGFALSYLWGWFITPTLNLPEIQVVQAIGIAFTVRYLIYQKKKKKEGSFKEHFALLLSEIKQEKQEQGFGYFICGEFIIPIAYPAIIIALGWIIHSFM